MLAYLRMLVPSYVLLLQANSVLQHGMGVRVVVGVCNYSHSNYIRFGNEVKFENATSYFKI